MKKILAVLLSVILVIGVLPISSLTASAAASEYYTYRISKGEVTITKCDTLISGDVSIPSTLAGYPVTSIGSYAFKDCYYLTSIIIPDSVTSIGAYAFEFCSNITSITIPSSITSISDYTFWHCSDLTSIIIPDSVTSIGESAFEYCSSLTSITIPDSVTSIGGSAFYNCSKLNKVNITNLSAWCEIEFEIHSSNPLHSAKNLYIDNVLLTNLLIPNNITSIGNYAFYGCTSFKSITIPDNITSIGISAFKHCSSLESIAIPDSVTSIDGSTFSNCANLKSITIPNSVTSIGNWAFSNCANLKSITIPNSVTSIGEYAFSDCISFTSVAIGNNVTNISEGAFRYCSLLKSISIPDNVTSIGNSAFKNCSSLNEVYYCGTEEKWNKISIGSSNSYLTNAIRYYHDFGDWQIRTESTCTEKGEKYGVCSICGVDGMEEIEINSDNHNYMSDGKCEWCGNFIESLHNYVEETEESWIITKENTTSITITFSSETYVEQDWDFICIYSICDGKETLVGKYTGDELASKSVTVSGDTAKIVLSSDKINTAYGFKVTNIEFTCAHKYSVETKPVTCFEDGYTKFTCEYCGDVYFENQITAIGAHIYENGNCKYCNVLLESDHDYENLFDETWTIYRKGAESITITFSADTFVEQRYDWIYIYNGVDENPIGEYTGDALASKSITIQGDTVKIRLKTDRVTTYYGFKITDISAEYVSGDFNGDSEVDVLDLIKLKNILLSNSDSDAASPDVNNDGLTNSEDLVFLRKYLFANF